MEKQSGIVEMITKILGEKQKGCCNISEKVTDTTMKITTWVASPRKLFPDFYFKMNVIFHFETIYSGGLYSGVDESLCSHPVEAEASTYPLHIPSEGCIKSPNPVIASIFL